MSIKKLNIALIGCGAIGKRHCEYIDKYAELVAVCDIEEEKAKEMANKYNCRKYYNILDLLENEKNLDLLSICTPNYLHAEHTVLGLQNGINVLCEKPMALTTYECEKMIQTAEKFIVFI